MSETTVLYRAPHDVGRSNFRRDLIEDCYATGSGPVWAAGIGTEAANVNVPFSRRAASPFHVTYRLVFDRIDAASPEPWHRLDFDLPFDLILRSIATNPEHPWHSSLSVVNANTERLTASVLASALRRYLESSPAAPAKPLHSGPNRAVLRATAAIRQMLPEFSEADLGRLVGVTRQTWRDWSQGKSVPRSNRRRRLYKLQRTLELRRTVGTEALSHWLESPLSSRDRRTPAELLGLGRDDLVASLAASPPSPDADDFVVEEIDLGVPTDRRRAEEALRAARDIAKDSDVLAD